MIRNLKVLGLALVAVFAMSAMVASTAFATNAQGEFTTDGPTTVTGVENPAVLTAFGNQEVKCNASYAVGTVNETPAGPIQGPLTTLTVKPTYKECDAFIGGATSSATVTMNSCDFVVHIGTTLAPNKWAGTADVVCTVAGDAIEVHAYTTTAHTSTVCTVKVPAQTGLTGGFVKNTEEATNKLTLGGPITGIRVSKTGVLCGGTKEETAAVQDIDAIVSGKNGGGGATGISITDTP